MAALAIEDRIVCVTTRDAELEGSLTIPQGALGIVLFAHGSGSGRHSPRNRFVAHALHAGGLGTLLMDLLTAEEERAEEHTRHLRFDISMLAERLMDATDWLAANPDTARLRIGYFGASTGAAAALVAAAERQDLAAAVVSRGGRPDLAGPELERVQAPVLLIVGGEDYPVVDMNRDALARLRAEREMVIVPGATHLFGEAGALEEVARLARQWFERFLTASF